MPLTKEQKTEIVGAHGRDTNDTGSTRVLAHFAETDAFDGPEAQRDMAEALAAANAGVTHTHSGTKHWFAEADRPEYDKTAADLAFGETVAFLRAHL